MNATQKPSQTFELVAGVNAVGFGSNPRFVLRADERLTTDDPRLIARLTAHPKVKTAPARPAKKHTPAAAKTKPASTPQVPAADDASTGGPE